MGLKRLQNRVAHPRRATAILLGAVVWSMNASQEDAVRSNRGHRS